MKAKHKILSVIVIERGQSTPISCVACLWSGNPIQNLEFYDDAYFHFTAGDLKKAKQNPDYFHEFTLVDYKGIGEWA